MPFWRPATETSASALRAVRQAFSSPSGQAESALSSGPWKEEGHEKGQRRRVFGTGRDRGEMARAVDARWKGRDAAATEVGLTMYVPVA